MLFYLLGFIIHVNCIDEDKITIFYIYAKKHYNMQFIHIITWNIQYYDLDLYKFTFQLQTKAEINYILNHTIKRI